MTETITIAEYYIINRKKHSRYIELLELQTSFQVASVSQEFPRNPVQWYHDLVGDRISEFEVYVVAMEERATLFAENICGLY